MQAATVDLDRRDDADDDAGRAAEHRVEELLALGVRALLGVVEASERPRAGVAQALVVEQHAGDDQRAGERAAAGLVRARHPARAEAPVEAEQPLARAGDGGADGGGGHRPRITASPARRPPLHQLGAQSAQRRYGEPARRSSR